MDKKGSITLFLALILSLLLSLVCTSMESVRMAAARTQILSGLDIGLYSLFAQYDSTLLKEYDLFFLNGSGSGEKPDLSSMYDEMEAYMKPVLKQNSQKLSIRQGGFTGYRLATDQDGEVLYRQIVAYMKATLGIQGIQKLKQGFLEKEAGVRQAEKAGTQAEETKSLDHYDAEMNTAAQNSEAAARQQETEEAGEESFSSGEAFSDGTPEKEVVNPIPILKRIRRMSLLELIVPADKGISEKEADRASLLSGRSLQKGMDMTEAVKRDPSSVSQLLFQKYLEEKLGNYRNPGQGALSYQLEYLLCGRTSDRENLKAVARRLLVIREGVNAAFLMSDPVKRAQVQSLALAIASAFLIPPASVVIEAALLFCWSFGESILDLRELFHGGKVPLIKNAGNWQLSLDQLPKLLEGLDSRRRGDENGLSYEEYLQLLLVSESKNKKLKRGMDMLEQSIKSRQGWEGFRLDHCVEAVEASVDVRANRRKTFTVKKQYSYL